MPLRLRLTLWYAVSTTAILVAGSAFLILQLRASLVNGVDVAMRASAEEVATEYKGGGQTEFSTVGSTAVADLGGLAGVQLVGTNGAIVVWAGAPATQAAILSPADLARVRAGATLYENARIGAANESYRVLAQPYRSGEGEQVLIVAAPLDGVEASVHRVVVLLVVLGPIAILIAAAAGWWLAGRAFSPVAAMTEKAADIGVGNLAERVNVPKPRDELRALAETFNAMLDRLQAGVDRERRFISDASHELRTPLAVARIEMDVSLREPGLSEGSRDALRSVRDEVDRMSTILDNLLTLARIDEGELRLERAPIDLHTAVLAAVEEIRPLAVERGVSVDAGGPSVEVGVDPPRIEQVLRNLLANAVKYSGEGGEVRAEVWVDEAEAGVRVSDTGPGISGDALPHLFDRFYRTDSARSRDEGGSGLGLAICKELVEAHGGRIWAESEPGAGSSFAFALPR